MKKIIRKIEYLAGIPINAVQAFGKLRRFHRQKKTLEETVALALSFGGHGYFKVKTMQVTSEITALARAVERLKPKIILEIGTAYGGTLLIWSQLASERVITCDIESKRIESVLYTAFPPPGSPCRVTLLSGDSHSPDFKKRVEQELAGSKADFLFIDGDHTEGGVAADYRDYREFVRPGGIIAFHDIVEKQHLTSNQVYHFWKKIKHEVRSEEFIHDRNQTGYGIGIIRVSDK
jgi:predicted O-methyltransferase YrrM